MKVLFIAWSVIALLITGVRIGHHFGYKDALEERPERQAEHQRRNLHEEARWPLPLDPHVARRDRQRAAFAVSLLILATAVAFWLR